MSNKTFLYLGIKKQFLKLHLFVDKNELSDPKKISKEIIKNRSSNRKKYRIILKTNSDIGYVLTLIRQGYDAN